MWGEVSEVVGRVRLVGLRVYREVSGVVGRVR